MSKKAHSITVHLDIETRNQIVRMAKEAGLKNSVFVGDVIIGEYLNQSHQHSAKKGGRKPTDLTNRTATHKKSPSVEDGLSRFD